MIGEVRLVATSGYLAAAAVALHSFRRHNPWFQGPTRVFCAPADRSQAEGVLALVPAVDFVDVSAGLMEAIDRAVAAGPGWVPERFYGLQMLADPSDGDVLLLDADLLFTASVEGLAAMPREVVACPEGAAHAGRRVDRATNAIVAAPPDPGLIDQTFNSGLVRLRGGLLGPRLFEAALRFVDPAVLGGLRRRQHDQFVLNRIFEGRWHAADASFNYLLGHHDTIHRATGIRSSEARVLHFNREPRPWDLPRCAALRDARYAHSVARWMHAYADALEANALLGAPTT